MGIRLEKPWLELNTAAIDALPGQMGVFHVADANRKILTIGFAGARDLFGIRTALEREVERHGSAAALFRYEFTSNYRSRWDELLMLHLHDHGALPPHQADEANRVGRLSPS